MDVKVWNDHHKDYYEKWNDREMRIPAHGYIVMGRSEAVKFTGAYTPIVRSGTGEDLNPKKLRIERDPEKFAEITDQPIRYESFDGQKFRTLEGMKKHEAEATTKKDNGAVNDAADAKRGRPAKSSEAA